MAMRKTLTLLFLLALALPAGLAFIGGCESNPAAPEFDNVFDPDNPEGSNPLALTATVSDSSILLSWNQPQGFGISYYELSHSLNYFSDFLPIGTVDHSEAEVNTFRYEEADPTTTHYFKIQAFDNDGNYTNVTDQTPTMRTTPPLVAIDDGSDDNGATQVASRNIEVLVAVTTGDSLRLSLDEDFAEETRASAAPEGETAIVPWVLPTVDSNDTTLTMHVLAFSGTSISDTTKVELDINFAPAFTVAGNPTTVPGRDLELDIPNNGVIFMRFADSQEELDNEAWRPGGPTMDYTIAESANPQSIWGEFQGDFGFSSTLSIVVTPDLLEESSFALDLPSDHITDQSTVTVLASAVAREMRFSESLDFTGLPWIEYADTYELALSPGIGQKVIYGQYRNDWAESAIHTDYVIYLSQPLDVKILAPADGDTLTSGISLQVLGSAISGSGIAPVDSVKFDNGDGTGWQAVTGLDSWTYWWDVPTVEIDTANILRARAWAAGDSVTNSVTVTIIPGESPD